MIELMIRNSILKEGYLLCLMMHRPDGMSHGNGNGRTVKLRKFYDDGGVLSWCMVRKVN